MRDLFVRLLTVLSEAHGGSSAEGAVRACLRSELGTEGQCDKTGNLCFQKEGGCARPVVMLAAHMDEVGLAVHSITKEGYLRVVAMGGFWTPTLIAQRFAVLSRAGKRVPGIVASKPVHLLSKEEKEGCPKVESLFLDVGARSAGEVREELGIRAGDPIVPDVAVSPAAAPDVLVGKAFDDRAGLAVATHVFQSLAPGHPNTVWLAGTVQEEIGCRGAQTVCERIKPDLCIILEGAPADDYPGSSPDDRQGALGAGPQVRVMDPTAVMNRGLTEAVLNTAAEKDIPCQTAVRRSGGTDAKSIHLAGEGVPTCVLGVPVRYIHTPYCLLDINDCLATVELLTALIAKLDAETVADFTAF